MNDIAWLVQLPPDATQTTFAPMTGFSGGPELVSRAVFDQLVTAPGDVTASYEQFQLVAMRFDVCDRGAGPCPAGADGRLRLVFQPIDDLMPSVAADDVALHALYPIPAADLAPVVDELRALAAIQDFPTDAPLAINQTLSAGASGEYATRLQALVSRYVSADQMVRLTLFAQVQQVPQLGWVFRGMNDDGSGFRDITIPGLAATTQRTSVVDWPAPVSYVTTPVADSPPGMQLALSGPAFAAASYADQQAALDALVRAQDPAFGSFASQQCVDCHVSTYLTTDRAGQLDVDPATLPGAFSSNHPLSIAFGVSASNESSLRAFGWFGKYPAISQRVVNELAVTLDDIAREFPPAP